MRKLNNKGMSIVELIVSFAIVTVAVVYFSQSLITVSKLFKNTKEETDAYVEEVYTYRLLESMFEEYSKNSQIGIQQAIWIFGFMNFNVYCDVDESNIDTLIDVSPSAKYKLHREVITDTQIDFQNVGGSCKDLETGLFGPLSDAYATPKEFKNANIWIPMNYYQKKEEDSLWFDWLSGGTVKTYNATPVNVEKFGFKKLQNYYNPHLKLFLSIAQVGEGENKKIYKYYTHFDYDSYISSGKTVIYVIKNEWFNTIKELFSSGIWTNVTNWINEMVTIFGDAFDIDVFIGGIGDTNILSDIINQISNFTNNLGSKAVNAFKGAFDGISNSLENIGENLKGSLNSAEEAFKNAGETLNKFGEAIGEAIKDGWDKFLGISNR